MQSIRSLYIKLSENNNKLKLQIRNKTTRGPIRIEWLRVQPTVKIIVQDYNKTLF